MFAFAASPAFCLGPTTKPLTVLQGQLTLLPGNQPAVKVGGKVTPLAAEYAYLLHTLQDKRLAGREVRLEGSMKPDGTFDAAKLFTVRDGKLFRVRYYCEVCNIEAEQPGKCVCCQQPTELQEIPVGRAAD